jgi:hypothetical protein
MGDTLKNSGAAKSQVEARLTVGKGGNCLREKSKSCPVEGPRISFWLNPGSNPLSITLIHGTMLTGLDELDGFIQPSGKSRLECRNDL